jgi:hypothetical protein
MAPSVGVYDPESGSLVAFGPMVASSEGPESAMSL